MTLELPSQTKRAITCFLFSLVGVFLFLSKLCLHGRYLVVCALKTKGRVEALGCGLSLLIRIVGKAQQKESVTGGAGEVLLVSGRAALGTTV